MPTVSEYIPILSLGTVSRLGLENQRFQTSTAIASPKYDRFVGSFAANCKPAACTRANPKDNPMNWDQIEGDWKQFKGKAQQQWGKLTNDDLDVIAGKRTEMLGLLQKRYGHDKEQGEKAINDWLDGVK